jgi:Ca2+-binding EF-hand superfamily protein
MTTSSEVFYNNPEIKQKIDTIKNYLWKFDKDMDDEIDKQEMLNFFDANMPNNKQYDRSLADKVFGIFDSDKSGKISVEEFIKTFIHMEEELKIHKSQLRDKILKEKKVLNDIQVEVNKYKNEQLNSEGLSLLSVINCEIVDIEFIKSKENYNSIKVRLSIGDYNETSDLININKESDIVQISSKFNMYVYYIYVY